MFVSIAPNVIQLQTLLKRLYNNTLINREVTISNQFVAGSQTTSFTFKDRHFSHSTIQPFNIFIYSLGRQRLIVSSRVKSIEEVPSLQSKTEAAKEETASETTTEASRMEDILSLNYSGSDKKSAKKKKTTSASEATKSEQRKQRSSVTKEISDYLGAAGSPILYADLIRDEIAQVDKKLIADSKKAGQIGGE